MKYDFFVAGTARNSEEIVKVCNILDKYNKSYYCFLKESYNRYGLTSQDIFEKDDLFQSKGIKDPEVEQIFKCDLEGLKSSGNFLLVLPSGKSGLIESGIAYGLNKKCYAYGGYAHTAHMYNIFEHIFQTEEDLMDFLEFQKK